MRLRHIEIFHAIYTNGSISAAARALHVSQPSVSKMLHHAEDQLGFRLFQIVRGRLVPTDEAHALYRDASDIFDRLGSLQQTARNLRSQGGHLRLAMVPSLALDMVPRAITRFRRTQRDVSFEVHTQHHDELVRSLQERECDIAIAYDPPPHPRLSMTKLAEGELVVLHGENQFGKSEGRLPLTALDGRDLIGVTAAGPLGDVFVAAAQGAGIDYRESISVQTFFVAAAIAELEQGITVVDEFTARHWATRGLSYRFVDPPLRFSLQCVFLEERPLPKLAQRFVDTLRATIAEEREGLPGPEEIRA
jgi:DNA-binding transcriptional LysR family regulator